MSDYFQIDDRCVVQPGRDGDSAVCVDVEVEASWGGGWAASSPNISFLWGFGLGSQKLVLLGKPWAEVANRCSSEAMIGAVYGVREIFL